MRTRHTRAHRHAYARDALKVVSLAHARAPLGRRTSELFDWLGARAHLGCVHERARRASRDSCNDARKFSRPLCGDWLEAIKSSWLTACMSVYLRPATTAQVAVAASQFFSIFFVNLI